MASVFNPSNSSRSSSEGSLPIGGFSPPQSDGQWRKALLDVKRLLIDQQYKQCALRCNQLIDTASNPLYPIHIIYLHYYAATAYEYMGRAAHIYSAVKIPLLTDAMQRFQTAYESLPALFPQPVLNPNQTYSPVSHSSPIQSSSYPMTVPGSPVTSTARDASPNPETSPSVDALSTQNLSAHNATGLYTPPFLLDSCIPDSSESSVTTAFCVTPPPAPRVSCLDYNDPPPAFHIPPPTRDPPPPPPPHDVSSHPVAKEQLVSFNSAMDGLPSGGSIVRNIARRIDNSVLAGADDPFVTRTSPKLRPPFRPPVRLSPIKFTAEIDDPVKQSELIPAPLAIRKHSGEMLLCSSALAICGDSKSESLEREVMRPARIRPPRLPLNVILSEAINTDTAKTSSSILAPQARRVSPLFPSPISMASSAPKRKPSSDVPRTLSPTIQKQVPVLGSPFTSRPGSPMKSCSLTSWSTKGSPASMSDEHTTGIAHCDSTLKWLSEHLPEEVAKLRKQIKHVTDVQQARRARNASMSRSVSFWTFSPVEPNTDSAGSPDSTDVDGSNIDEYGNVLRVESKAQRIKRLRKEGWVIGLQSKHSRFKGTEYYDKLCEDALAELGPTGMGSLEWSKR